MMYLIYVLDLPLIFTPTRLTLQQEQETTTPTASTFVDDTVTTVELGSQDNHQETIDNTMNKLENYTRSNTLILNRDKTKFLIIPKKNTTRENLHLKANPTNIKPIRNFKFLGVPIADTLHWGHFLVEGKNSLLSQLKKRIAALKKIRHQIKDDLLRKLTNGIYMSKLN